MKGSVEIPVEGRINRVPVTRSPGGVLVAERGLHPTNGDRNGHRAIDFDTFKPDRSSGLLVPERKKAGPFDFVIMTDFGGNSTKTDTANAEVDLNIRSIARQHNVEVGGITLSPLEGFSTINTGFATAQLAVHKDHADIDRVYYVNTNPRLDPDDARSWTDDDNFGKFVYAKLKNGARVFTVNSKYNLSFLKDHIDEAWVLKTERNDQFLSRRQFVQSTMVVLSGDESYYDKPLDVSTIADPPEGDLVAQDGNGNLKTSWKIGHLRNKPGIREAKTLRVVIDGVEHIARNNLFEKGGETGDLVVQGGSSGYDDRYPPTDDQLVEVVVLYGAANEEYGVKVVKDNTKVTIVPSSSNDIHRAAA